MLLLQDEQWNSYKGTARHSHSRAEWVHLTSATGWCSYDAKPVWRGEPVCGESKLGQKQAVVLVPWGKRATEVYILKQYFLLGVITRGRSNLVPDQSGDWMCGLAVLEVRASGSWWTTIDWGGTWRYSCSRSTLIFCKCSSGEQAEWESRTRGSCQVIFSNIRKFFFSASFFFPLWHWPSPSQRDISI